MAGAWTIYGIRNCDTMKKARAWLDAHGVAYQFHDYRADGIDATTVRKWAAATGWEPLVNRAGTTFRNLAPADKEDLTESKAVALMVANPTVIKRPVLTDGRTVLVGFKPEIYAATFS